MVEEFIEVCKILRDKYGVDLLNLKSTSTIESLLNVNDDNKNVLEEFKSDLNKYNISYKSIRNIGQKLTNIREIYNDNDTLLTHVELDALQNDLGLRIKRKNVTNELISICEVLKDKNIDISNIRVTDTIDSLVFDDKDEKGSQELKEEIKEDLSKRGLKYEDVNNIGYKLGNIKSVYNGRMQGTVPTKEQVEKLNELGVNIKRKSSNRTADEFIKTCKILRDKYNVDVSNVGTKTKIEDILDYDGKNKDEVIDSLKNDLEKEDIDYENVKNLGNKLSILKNVSRGKSKGFPITEKQYDEICNLGIAINKDGRNITDEFIKACKILRDDFNVDVTKIKQGDTIEDILNINNTKEGKTKIDEFKNILRKEDIKYKNIKNIGTKLTAIRSNVSGKGNGMPPTKEQIDTLQNDLNIRVEKRNSIDEFIKTCEILRDKFDVDLSKITCYSKIEDLFNVNDDAKRIAIEKELNDNGIYYRKVENIGKRLNTIRSNYHGSEVGVPITDEQVDIIQNDLGIKIEKMKRTATDIGKASLSVINDIDMCDEVDNDLKSDIKNNNDKENENIK